MNFDDFLRWEETDHDVIKVKRIYVDIAEDLIAGILLSQIVYWHLPSKNGHPKLRVAKDGHLWLAKGRDDWWDECRISAKQFDRAIARLAGKGVVKQTRFRFDGSPVVHVRLVPEVLMEHVDSLTKSMGYGKLDFTQMGNSNLPNGEIPSCPKGKNITETTTESTTQTTKEYPPPPGRGNTSNTYSQEFEEFWKAYPRKISKKGAWWKWQARLRDEDNPVTIATLMQAAKNYAQVCKVEERVEMHILYPETFLGPGLRYKDYIDDKCVEVAKRGAKAGRRRNDPDDGAYRSGDDDDFWDKLGRT